MSAPIKVCKNIVGMGWLSVELMWTNPGGLKVVDAMLKSVSMPGLEWKVVGKSICMYAKDESQGGCLQKIDSASALAVVEKYVAESNNELELRIKADILMKIMFILLMGVIGLSCLMFNAIDEDIKLLSFSLNIVFSVWIGYCSLVYESMNKWLLATEDNILKLNNEFVKTDDYKSILAKGESDVLKKDIGLKWNVQKIIKAL